MPFLLSYQFSSEIFYRLPIAVTQTIFRVSNGVSLLHPLVDENVIHFRNHQPVFVPMNSAWFGTPHLTFLLDSAPTEDPRDTSILDDVLARLRRISRQASLPRKYVSVSPSRVDSTSFVAVDLSAALDTETARPAKMMVNRYLYSSAITEAHLCALDEPHSKTSEAYEDLLLDAIEALSEHNFRSAILYAAFAAEAAASAALVTAYEAMMESRPSHIRVSSFAAGGGKVSTKDPVYEALKGRDEFKTLLHERPLYLLQRSLMSDDEGLYQSLAKLHRTRNTIVHSVRRTDVFPLDEDMAIKCIESVRRLLAWFELPDGFILPGGFIDSSTGMERIFT